MSDSGLTGKLVDFASKWILAKSDGYQDSLLRKEARLATLEVQKRYVNSDLDTFAELKRSLLHRLYEARELDEKFRVERDLEDLERRMRRLAVCLDALAIANQLPEPREELPDAKQSTPTPWWEQFEQIAANRNEDWRTALMAKALAVECTVPGSVSLRALWLIGTLQESAFAALSALLSVCSRFGDAVLMIPFPPEIKSTDSRKTPGIDSLSRESIEVAGYGLKSLTELLYEFDGTGLFVSAEKHVIFRDSYSDFTVRRRRRRYTFKSVPSAVRGLNTTRLGSEFGRLISAETESRREELGDEILDDWAMPCRVYFGGEACDPDEQCAEFLWIH